MSLELSGNRISELESVQRISEDTEFLISHIRDVASNVLDSYGLEYRVLSDYILHEISSMLSLNTMAYENKYNYSKITHKHDYSHVDAKVYYGPNSERSELTDDVVCLGVIEISNYNEQKQLSICVPDIQFQKPKEYRVGELKFVYLSSNDVQNELNGRGYSLVNGWVIPDGSTYNKSDFSEAYELYKGTSTTTFNVPNITGFFRLNPGIYKDDALQYIPFQNSQVKHVHQIYQRPQLGHIDMSVNFELTSTLKYGRDIAAHCGREPPHSMEDEGGCEMTETIDLDKDVTVTGTGMKVYEVQSINEQTYPTHDTMAIVLYLGEYGI